MDVINFLALGTLTAEPIWAGLGARYALLRREVMLPPGQVRGAVARVAAVQSGRMEKLLGAYRFYVNGEPVGIGPGRGGVRTAAYPAGGDTDHTYYDTFNLTRQLVQQSGTGVLALGLQCYHESGDTSAGVLLELELVFTNGSRSLVQSSSSDGRWQSYDATAAFGPTSYTGSSYRAPQEWAVSGLMPTGWTRAGFQPSPTQPAWTPPASRVGTTPSLAPAALRAKPTQPLHLESGVRPASLRQLSPGVYFADFGREMMGGLTLRLPASDFPVGSVVQITLGEELTGDATILYPMRTGNHVAYQTL